MTNFPPMDFPTAETRPSGRVHFCLCNGRPSVGTLPYGRVSAGFGIVQDEQGLLTQTLTQPSGNASTPQSLNPRTTPDALTPCRIAAESCLLSPVRSKRSRVRLILQEQCHVGGKRRRDTTQ